MEKNKISKAWDYTLLQFDSDGGCAMSLCSYLFKLCTMLLAGLIARKRQHF